MGTRRLSTKLTSFERRTLTFMWEDATALRDLAAERKFDMVCHLLDMAVIEMAAVLDGKRPIRRDSASHGLH